MRKACVILLFLLCLSAGVFGQPKSFELGATFMSGWTSHQLQSAQSWGMRGGVFGNYRISKHFGVETGFNFFRENGNDTRGISLSGLGQDATYSSASGGKGLNSQRTSFIEVPLLLRIYVVQNEKTPWEVNIDGGYSLMRQVSDFDLAANRSPYSHNLVFGLAVQRMLSGPFFLGMTMRTTALNITNAEMGSRHLWELGLRAGMKLNGKW